tara:strand:+ start:98 stop:247 length:150 start_codon:yes stop_codon:yes gene_type:complete
MGLFQKPVLSSYLESVSDSDIDKTDKEIDQMVYDLYGLTKEEIEIVENS